MNALTPGLPRWAALAAALRGAIQRGEYDVGALLPTEMALAAAFGVSRQTVRQAIGALRREGLVSARKGVGTRVEATSAEAGFTHTLNDLADVFQFAARSVFRVLSTERRVPRGRMAQRLGTRAGDAWLHLRGLRETADGARVLGLTEVWVDGAYAAAAEAAPARREAIFAAIEAAHGLTIGTVRQEIEATVLGAADAAVLGMRRGAPALRITRNYLTTDGRLVELTSTLHPEPGFRYAITLRRAAG
ncbi:GntR family transcriptional regulator [Roseomonas sp. HF4]|uniref:GntR family transcriptional regulator n=1 Tax=Roseomonas sp. HF4 TaxID=2562313 RepID=UPI0010C14749|nr:GntR family transcriptional regulator [Roseomonas sp. HF4]